MSNCSDCKLSCGSLQSEVKDASSGVTEAPNWKSCLVDRCCPTSEIGLDICKTNCPASWQSDYCYTKSLDGGKENSKTMIYAGIGAIILIIIIVVVIILASKKKGIDSYTGYGPKHLYRYY